MAAGYALPARTDDMYTRVRTKEQSYYEKFEREREMHDEGSERSVFDELA
jgi:hypothetical protein